MKNAIIFLLATTILFSCRQQSGIHKNSNGKNSPTEESLTKKLNSAFEKNAIKGFSVAVVDETKIIYHQGFGNADLEQQKAYTSNTTQNIGSISKTLIAIALMKAQELGKLNINDPINQYLPFKIVNPYHPEIPIRIKHLAYHTSTITDLDEIYGKSYVLTHKNNSDNEYIPDYFNQPENNIPVSDFIKNSLTLNGKWYTQNSFSKDKPGEKYEYTNIGAALCALIIEYATGQDFRDFTKKHIIRSLKMESSGWVSDDINSSQRSRLFADKNKMIAEYSLITYADGGFLTSSYDLGLFLSELIKGYHGNGTLLSKKSYKTLFRKQEFLNKGKIENYGIFMEYRDKFLYVQDAVIGHNGSDPGVFTAMYFEPDRKKGKVVLVNTDTDGSENIWPEITEIWKLLSAYDVAH